MRIFLEILKLSDGGTFPKTARLPSEFCVVTRVETSRLYIVGSSQIPLIIIAVEGCTMLKTCSLLVLRDARFGGSNGPRTKSKRSPNKVRTKSEREREPAILFLAIASFSLVFTLGINTRSYRYLELKQTAGVLHFSLNRRVFKQCTPQGNILEVDPVCLKFVVHALFCILRSDILFTCHRALLIFE